MVLEFTVRVATVTAVDEKTRQITLKGPEGVKLTLAPEGLLIKLVE